MYCTNCGAPNSDQADFCTTCGANLKAPKEQQPQQAYAPTPQPEQTHVPQPQQAYTPPQQQQPQQAYAPPPQQQPYQGQAYPQQPVYGYPPQAPPKKKKTGLIIGVVVGVVVLAIVLGLVLSSGGGGGSKGGLVGKWAVMSDYSYDHEEGLIFNFKSNGTLTYEAPKGTPDDLKGIYEFMNMVKTKYKTSGDKLTLTVEFFGEKDSTEYRFKVEGDTLTLYESGSSPTTVLKRTK
ncbi:MAG TPA: zinc ribbon domain-containing protein [Clostridia bacterium]|nr:zinc ribbon domain-containing protein [Clostridia bacterium]